MDTNILIYGVLFLNGVILLIGCVGLGYILWPSKNNKYKDDDNGRFYFINNDDLPEEWNMFDIIVDKETRVQYLQDIEGYSLTPLIDSEGKLILYTGDFDE